MDLKKRIQEGGIHVDNRGVIRFINEFPRGVKRMYQVENLRAGRIRAWHGHMEEAKYVYVPGGIVEVKIIGMKPGVWGGYIPSGPSSHIVSFVLSSMKPSILHIPPRYYNGFKTLTDDAIIQFFSTSTLEESKKDDQRLPWDHFGKEVWEEKNN